MYIVVDGYGVPIWNATFHKRKDAEAFKASHYPNNWTIKELKKW